MPNQSNHRGARAAAAAALACALSTGAFAGDLSPITRVEPQFPYEASSAGIDSGHVKARMTVDASGEVTRVEILDAAPRRIFERAVIRTLSQWKFAPGAGGRSMEIEIDFHR